MSGATGGGGESSGRGGPHGSARPGRSGGRGPRAMAPAAGRGAGPDPRSWARPRPAGVSQARVPICPPDPGPRTPDPGRGDAGTEPGSEGRGDPFGGGARGEGRPAGSGLRACLPPLGRTLQGCPEATLGTAGDPSGAGGCARGPLAMLPRPGRLQGPPSQAGSFRAGRRRVAGEPRASSGPACVSSPRAGLAGAPLSDGGWRRGDLGA